MRRRSGPLLLAGSALLTVTLVGCGSNPRPTDSTAPSPSASPSSSVPSTSEPPRTQEPTPTTPAPPSVEPTVPTPAADACAFGSLAVTALPGSGSSGTQFATLQFTNTSGATCSLTGAPAAALRLSGAELGSPATTSSTPATTVRLAPGAVATAQVSGPSTCDAPLSDSIRVTPPGTASYVDVQTVLRACPLTVDPVTAG